MPDDFNLLPKGPKPKSSEKSQNDSEFSNSSYIIDQIKHYNKEKELHPCNKNEISQNPNVT